MTTRKVLAEWFHRVVKRPDRLHLRSCMVAAVLAVCGLAATGTEARAELGIDVRAEIKCLAQNIYFEARSEPDAGKLAVGHVVMNRVASGDYPNRVCAVVRQGGEDRLHNCQFSWWCDGRSDKPTDKKAWEHAKALARSVYWNFSPDPTDGAKWYHADYVTPSWRKRFERGPVIGRHVFYRAPNQEQASQRGPQVAER